MGNILERPDAVIKTQEAIKVMQKRQEEAIKVMQEREEAIKVIQEREKEAIKPLQESEKILKKEIIKKNYKLVFEHIKSVIDYKLLSRRIMNIRNILRNTI